MVAFFDPKNIVQPVVVQGLDMRGIGTQAVFGDNELEVRVVLAQLRNKPFGGIAFAIIFLRSILFHDRFRHQRNHCTHVRMNDRRAQHLMRIGDRPVAVDFLQTRCTVNRLGGKIPRAIERQ